MRCKSGQIYIGVNMYSLHGTCAEQVAIGAAISNGEREFECIVAVRGKQGEEVLPTYGNCRQMLSDYMPKCDVIINSKDGSIKVKAEDLLPFGIKLRTIANHGNIRESYIIQLSIERNSL